MGVCMCAFVVDVVVSSFFFTLLSVRCFYSFIPLFRPVCFCEPSAKPFDRPSFIQSFEVYHGLKDLMKINFCFGNL